MIAKSIDLQAGKKSATVPLASLLRKELTGPASDDLPPKRGESVVTPQDQRWLFPALRQQSLNAELSVQELKQVGSATVDSGSVERDPVSTDPKAEVDVQLESVNPKVRQLACVISDVPNAILEAESTLRAFLQQQMQFGLNTYLDAHVLAQIDAEATGVGQVGANLVEVLRNGISAMRANGVNPSLVALSPEDSVDLDLTTVGSDGMYLFSVNGGQAPWRLKVVEVANVVNPVLIDPAALGILYLQAARFAIDSSGDAFVSNTSVCRLEFNCLMHVRIPDGALELGGS
jgi:hypothetical protein